MSETEQETGTRFSRVDSYGSRLAFEFISDDGEHASAVQVTITNPDGTRATNVQFIGGGVARVLDLMRAFLAEVQS